MIQTKVFQMMVAVVALVFVAVSPSAAQEQEPAAPAYLPKAPAYLQAPAAIQISSNISDGSHAIDDIATIAKKAGLDVVIMTDRDLMRWQYGLWPLRRVIKRTIENRSIFTYGIKQYLADIAAAQKKHPGMVIIGGIESAPFYFWKESFAQRRLTIKNWHKHMLVIGLANPEHIRLLPVTGNIPGLALPCGLGCIGYILFPLLVIAAGIWCIFNRRFGYTRFHQVFIETGRWRAYAIGGVVIGAGIALLLYGYPYRDLKFDQFGGDRGIMPYQNFIDYVNDHGGMAFWAHPEMENIESTAHVDIVTPEHSEALLQARDYTGFTIFEAGYERVGKPGGIWDAILNEYCEGKRARPIWAIGGLGIDKTTDPALEMRNLRTVFLVPALTERDVLAALREGRMYVVRGRNAGRLALAEFTARDPSGTAARTMGEELVTSAAPELRISCRMSHAAAPRLKIRLIRDGVVIETFDTASPAAITYRDLHATDRELCYYRLEIEADGVLLVTNPIFVRRES